MNNARDESERARRLRARTGSVNFWKSVRARDERRATAAPTGFSDAAAVASTPFPVASAKSLSFSFFSFYFPLSLSLSFLSFLFLPLSLFISSHFSLKLCLHEEEREGISSNSVWIPTHPRWHFPSETSSSRAGFNSRVDGNLRGDVRGSTSAQREFSDFAAFRRPSSPRNVARVSCLSLPLSRFESRARAEENGDVPSALSPDAARSRDD